MVVRLGELGVTAIELMLVAEARAAAAGAETRLVYWAKSAGVNIGGPFEIVLGNCFVEHPTKKPPDIKDALRVRRPLLTA